MGFLQKVQRVTLSDKMLSCEIHKSLPKCSVTPPNREIPALLIRPRNQNDPGKIGEQSCWPHPRESGRDFVHGPGGVSKSPTLLGPVLVWSQRNYHRLLKTLRYFEAS